MNKLINQWMNEWYMKEIKKEQMNEYMNEWIIHQWNKEGTNEWINESTNE